MNFYKILYIIMCFNFCGYRYLYQAVEQANKCYCDTTPQKVLLIVAHQDDDAFIVSKLRDHILAGDSVFVLWTCKSYQGDSIYGDIRIQEAISAMQLLGLDSNSYHFLNYPDMLSFKHIAQIVKDITTVLIDYKPDIVYIQAFEMGNIDHDVAHFCTVQSIRKTNYICRVFEFPQYSTYNLSGLFPFDLRIYPDTLKSISRKLNEEEMEFVIKYWKIYESQRFPMMYYFYFLGTLNDLFEYEVIRTLPVYDYTKKPFDAQAAYERYIPNIKYEDFQKAVMEYLRE